MSHKARLWVAKGATVAQDAADDIARLLPSALQHCATLERGAGGEYGYRVGSDGARRPCTPTPPSLEGPGRKEGPTPSSPMALFRPRVPNET